MLRSFALALSLCVIGAAFTQEPRSAPTAADGEDLAAAAQKAKEASQKLVEIQKAAAATVAKVRNTVAQTVAPSPFSRGSTERDVVDPQDPVERFALLTAGGPLIVQASLTIDGQPFRLGREKLLTDMIALADADKDGRTTWLEAMASPRFTFGRFNNANVQFRDTISRSLDRNSNSQVEPAEARQFLAQFAQGPTFSFGGGPTALRTFVPGLQAAGARHPDLLALLDRDESKSLDVQERSAALTRLKSRDADDNDALEAAEITGELPSSMVRLAVDRPSTAVPPDAILLGPTAMQAAVFTALRQKYKNAHGVLVAESFPLFPELFAALDRDRDGTVELTEVLGLNQVQPHVVLQVEMAAQKANLKIESLAAEIRTVTDQRNKQVLEMPGVRITLTANPSAQPAARNYEMQSKTLLTQFDKDGNGYLDKTELLVPGQFELYDEDGDGKAYPAEIAAGYALQTAPQQTQIVANVVHQSNSLFETVDANSDGRLSLREMRSAGERLTALDKDQDQSIAGREIPEAISVSFALGTGVNSVLTRAINTFSTSASTRSNAAPAWFTRMDRNGDGDVTLKEFLGTEDEFQRLDASGDGLLDSKEARAAK